MLLTTLSHDVLQGKLNKLTQYFNYLSTVFQQIPSHCRIPYDLEVKSRHQEMRPKTAGLTAKW